MAMWRIFGTVGGRVADKLMGCRIEVTPRPGGPTYQFLPPHSVGNGTLGSTHSNPPRFTGIHYQGETWSLSSNIAPPANGSTWNGSFTSSAVDPASEEGSWTAEVVPEPLGEGAEGADAASH